MARVQFRVTMDVSVDVEAWETEYGTTGAEALDQIQSDLLEWVPQFASAEKWRTVEADVRTEVHSRG